MQFPSAIYYKRFAKYKSDFINLSQTELDFIGSKYLNSQFLRIWSNIGYSGGRFWDIKEIDDGETVEIIEILDIDLRMKGLYYEWTHVFDAISKDSETLAMFQTCFRNGN